MKTKSAFLLVVLATPLFAEDPYLEPGSFRLSHEFVLENVLHRVSSGWNVNENAFTKTYTNDGPSKRSWKGEWGGTLLTEAATRITPDIFGRVLFGVQGDYADRFWRPNNYEHHIDETNRYVYMKQAEGRIDRDEWFAHAYSGVGHNDWSAKGDFFRLYPKSYGDDDYLGISGYFGMYPDRFKQDNYLNIAKRHAPQGLEAGAQWSGFEAGVAYGKEVQWGYGKGGYGRLSAALGSWSKLTFVYKDEDVPYAVNQNEFDERNRAYALSWFAQSEAGNSIEAGVMYEPFRLGRQYQVANEVAAGSGLLGSSTELSTKTSRKKDALAEKIRLEQRASVADRVVVLSEEGTYAGVLAGNKKQIDLGASTDLLPVFFGSLKYTYRKPLEGPLPFLYEGTPDNIGAVASTPRGIESPFWVNWDNREAVFLTTTFLFDPTPGTHFFRYNPDTLQTWNFNPLEDAPVVVGFQYRMSDYRTTTDHLYYIDQDGNYQFEPAATSGAWATDHPISEYRLIFAGAPREFKWMLGLAGGQSLPYQSLAYTNDTDLNKPITDFYSIEGRLERWPFVLWAHYGSGVWGPEPYQYGFGESFDRLWGGGITYKITVNTTIDVNYLGARQDDTLFVAPDLGSYDEIRTLFSHRFGFLFQLSDAARAGYRAR